jgi:uncharacterized protein DUF4136
MSHNNPDTLRSGGRSSTCRQRQSASLMRLLLMLACGGVFVNPANAQKVTTDFDPQTDFSQFHTYTWGEGRAARNPLIGQRIVAGVEAQLAAKGLRKAAGSEAVDLIVVYQTATDTQTQINTYNSGAWGGYWGWGMGGYSQTSVKKIPVGQLIVDMADVNKRKFVWRGTASGTISDKPEKMNKMLDKALAKMFENYPPKAKK